MRSFFQSKKFTLALFSYYIAVLLWILLLKLGVQFSYMQQRSVNLIPYANYFKYRKIDPIENILNIFIFIPMGIYVGALFQKWTTVQKFFFFIFFSFVLELSQYILKIGAFDSSDILNNSVGAGIGLFIINNVIKHIAQWRIYLNLLASLVSLFIFLFLLLLKLNLLPIRYQ